MKKFSPGDRVVVNNEYVVQETTATPVGSVGTVLENTVKDSLFIKVRLDVPVVDAEYGGYTYGTDDEPLLVFPYEIEKV